MENIYVLLQVKDGVRRKRGLALYKSKAKRCRRALKAMMFQQKYIHVQ